METTYEFFALSKDNDRYVQMTAADARNCAHGPCVLFGKRKPTALSTCGAGQLMGHPPTGCEVKQVLCENQFVATGKGVAYSLPMGPQQLHIECNEAEGPDSYVQVHDQGHVKIPPGCDLNLPGRGEQFLGPPELTYMDIDKKAEHSNHKFTSGLWNDIYRYTSWQSAAQILQERVTNATDKTAIKLNHINEFQIIVTAISIIAAAATALFVWILRLYDNCKNAKPIEMDYAHSDELERTQLTAEERYMEMQTEIARLRRRLLKSKAPSIPPKPRIDTPLKRVIHCANATTGRDTTSRRTLVGAQKPPIVAAQREEQGREDPFFQLRELPEVPYEVTILTRVHPVNHKTVYISAKVLHSNYNEQHDKFQRRYEFPDGTRILTEKNCNPFVAKNPQIVIYNDTTEEEVKLVEPAAILTENSILFLAGPGFYPLVSESMIPARRNDRQRTANLPLPEETVAAARDAKPAAPPNGTPP
jgi:hypothetical protein